MRYNIYCFNFLSAPTELSTQSSPKREITQQDIGNLKQQLQEIKDQVIALYDCIRALYDCIKAYKLL